MKITFKLILIIFCLVVLWIIGLFAQLPLIPWIETDYFLIDTKTRLANNVSIKQKDNMKITLEIPNIFGEGNQSLQIQFSSIMGKHLINVNPFSMKVYDSRNIEIKPKSSYLICNDSTKAETFKIKDYEIADDTVYGNTAYSKDKYLIFQSSFDLRNVKQLSIDIQIKYSLDNKPDSINGRYLVEKEHRLTWNQLRFH